MEGTRGGGGGGGGGKIGRVGIGGRREEVGRKDQGEGAESYLLQHLQNSLCCQVAQHMNCFDVRTVIPTQVTHHMTITCLSHDTH